MTDLISPPPDAALMAERIAAAEAAWLDGLPLTPGQERIVAMTMHAGGCPSGGVR